MELWIAGGVELGLTGGVELGMEGGVELGGGVELVVDEVESRQWRKVES